MPGLPHAAACGGAYGPPWVTRLAYAVAARQTTSACTLVTRALSTLSWAARCSWIFTASWSTASASLYVASERLSAAAARTFWPTMITESSTNWRKVWDTQDTRTTALPELVAEGRLTSASAAKAYAHHIVPTPVVTLTASHALNRFAGLPPGCWSATLVGGGAVPVSFSFVRR